MSADVEPQFQAVPKPEDFQVPAESAAAPVVVNQTFTGVEDAIDSIPLLVKETKAGYKTTEFWLTIATSLLVVLNGIPLPEKYEGIVVAALAGLYAVSRGVAKKGIPEVVPAGE